MTPRTLRRSPVGWWLCCALALASSGCDGEKLVAQARGQSTTNDPDDYCGPPGLALRVEWTQHSVAGAILPPLYPRSVHVPEWSGLTPSRIRQLKLELDTTVAQDADQPDNMGTKTLAAAGQGYVAVWVGPAGAMEHPSGLLYAGQWCHEEATIYVSWRCPGQPREPVLPAYAHELGHVFGGLGANHNGAGCPSCAVRLAAGEWAVHDAGCGECAWVTDPDTGHTDLLLLAGAP